ncbi:hypothetical protein QL285_056790 [Trifolium repens]|nr:hypothetical protein QL285_056790 [Trifolium repens]
MAKKKRTTAKTQTQAKPMENPSKTTKKSGASKKSSNKKETNPKNEELFNVVFHHGGEFFKENDSLIYRGGVQTVVSGEKMSNWSNKSHVFGIVMGWGYNVERVKLWSRFRDFDNGRFFKLREYDDYMEVAIHSVGGGVDAEIYVDNKIDGDDDSDSGYDSDVGVKFNDSEDERTIGLEDGFGADPIPEKTNENNMQIVLSSIGCSSGGKFDDDEYESEELNSSDPDASDEERGLRYEKYRKEKMGKKDKFKCGMEFTSLKDFRFAIRDHNVRNGYDIKFVKNEGDRVRVKCNRGCPYYVLCSQVGQSSTFAIKTEDRFIKHTCIKSLTNKAANSKWVSTHVVNQMHTSQKVRIKDIIQLMRTNFSLIITPSTAWKAKQYASAIIEGDADRQYGMLRRYAEELFRVSKRNTVKIGVDRPIPSIHPRFSSFYFCFEGCKKGFTNGCRPFIGVDGCHLKTKYGGQLLIAVGRDPNDQYFPLAFGVVENETKESWRWFIQLLMEDLGTDNRYVFISDQQKGLVAVFDDMFDRIEHRLCLRHLYANFKKKFGGGAMIRDLMMGAAKATYVQAWEQKMEELKKVDKQAWEWLVKVPTKYWCKHAFNFYSKCDVLMNNLSESFNATILVARDKPILTLCEWIRNYLMNRMMTCVAKLERWEHRMMPMPMKRLEKEIVMAGTWHPTLSSAGEIWQVSHQYNGQQFIVDTLKKTCSCNFWELDGIPCRHAVAPAPTLAPESVQSEAPEAVEASQVDCDLRPPENYWSIRQPRDLDKVQVASTDRRTIHSDSNIVQEAEGVRGRNAAQVEI